MHYCKYIYIHSLFNVLKLHEALYDARQCGVDSCCHPEDCRGRILETLIEVFLRMRLLLGDLHTDGAIRLSILLRKE